MIAVPLGASEARVPSEAQVAKRPNNTVPVIFELVGCVRGEGS